MPDPTTNFQGLMLLILTALLGAVGLLVVLGLLIAWRKALFRRQTLERERAERALETAPDIWATSGQRLTARMSEAGSEEEASDPGSNGNAEAGPGSGAGPSPGSGPGRGPSDPPGEEGPDQDPADWWKRS